MSHATTCNQQSINAHTHPIHSDTMMSTLLGATPCSSSADPWITCGLIGMVHQTRLSRPAHSACMSSVRPTNPITHPIPARQRPNAPPPSPPRRSAPRSPARAWPCPCTPPPAPATRPPWRSTPPARRCMYMCMGVRNRSVDRSQQGPPHPIQPININPYVRPRAHVHDGAALEGLGVVDDGRVVRLHPPVVRQHLLLVVQVL